MLGSAGLKRATEVAILNANYVAARLEPHAAEHVLLECLGEIIWRAQREGKPMDALAYVESVRQAASRL